MGRLLAAAEDDGVARGKGDGRGVGRDIRPALVDEEHHSERHADFANDQTVRPRLLAEHLADGIRLGSHRLDAGRDPFNPLFVEQEPIDLGGCESEGRGVGDIEGIRGENLGHIAADPCCRGPQAGGFLLADGIGEVDRGAAGPTGHAAAVVVEGGGGRRDGGVGHGGWCARTLGGKTISYTGSPRTWRGRRLRPTP